MNYTALPDAEASQLISEQLQSYDREHERRYAAIGLAALECERRELWKHWQVDGFPCRSFAGWVRAVCPHAYSTVYAALADVKALADVPLDDIAQIRESNFYTMKGLSTSVRRDPEVLHAASQSSNAAFVSFVQDKHPGQAIERVQPMKLTFTASQRAVVDEAIAKAKERGDANSAPEWVERMAAEYLDDVRLDESYQGNVTEVVQ